MSRKLRKYDPDFVPSPTGRTNSGIICFFNSMRAALESLSSFNEVLEAYKEDIPKLGKMYIRNVIENLDSQNTQATIENGQKLVIAYQTAIKKLGIQSGIGFATRQEDASEGLDKFLLVFGDKFTPMLKLFRFRYTREFICDGCNGLALSDEFMNHVETQHKLFNIKTPPSDEYDGTKYEKFMYNIKKFVDRYDNDFICQKCHKRKGGDTIDTLKVLPEVMVIHLNQDNIKNNKYFPFYCRFKQKGKNSYLHYKLVAQINHYGTRMGGHYNARVLRPTPDRRKNKVWLMNDSSVTPSSFERSKNAYLLFYHYFEPTKQDPYIHPVSTKVETK